MINLLWFKRDLRLTDHSPLEWLCRQEIPAYLIYVFEPELINDDHYSQRHWRFIYESLQEMQKICSQNNIFIKIFYANAVSVLEHISKFYKIKNLVSYEETGLAITFKRDQAVQAWCLKNDVKWLEFQTNAVIRRLPNRDTWDSDWKRVMKAPIVNPNLKNLSVAGHLDPFGDEIPLEWKTTDLNFQKGGSSVAQAVAASFLQDRGKHYHFNLSKPEKSRITCSRLSPYLAWGNISLRELYQTLLQQWSMPGWRKPLQALISRLHWHCHFIQKFENESGMEHRPMNKGYSKFPYRKDEKVEAHLKSWKVGMTGYPMVDAAMRCVNKTGYLNFRMRAMLVSFLCHHLLIDWRLGIKHLASVFLDFEPGIHYAQFQMQASVTGINTIRMYNPVKQGFDNDPDGVFIAKWCPELAALPSELRHEPWKSKPMDAMFYGFEQGKHYPDPIVDLKEAGKWARDILWSWRKRPAVKKEAERILSRHVRKRAPSSANKGFKSRGAVKAI